MTKRSRPQSRPVARAPFHRGAYVQQYALSKQADQWVAQHDPDGPALESLIGSPELGGRRGSNRSEITPAFTYYAVFGEVDPDGPMITLADGSTMLVEEYEALVAEPDIDSVSQHATTAHRDRRLMSAASITRTRYVGPCVNRGSDDAPQWQRASTTKRGALVWRECPVACPKGCKADHRHVRHQHRDQGTLYVHQTAPYGEDGLDRGTVRTTRSSVALVAAPHGHQRFIPVEHERRDPASKRQGRRAKRMAIGRWTDSTYAVDPTASTVGAYVVPVPVDQEATVEHGWTQWHAPTGTPDAIARTVSTRWYVPNGDGTVSLLPVDQPEQAPIAFPYLPMGNVPTVPARPERRTVLVRSWARESRECEIIPAEWVRSPFIPVKVRQARGTTPVLALGRTGLLARIASDPAAVDLANRVLLAVEHAWTTNGQPVSADKGLTLTVLPADGGPTLTITRGDTVLAEGTYKSRRRLVRTAVASILT